MTARLLGGPQDGGTYTGDHATLEVPQVQRPSLMDYVPGDQLGPVAVDPIRTTRYLRDELVGYQPHPCMRGLVLAGTWTVYRHEDLDRTHAVAAAMGTCGRPDTFAVRPDWATITDDRLRAHAAGVRTELPPWRP